MTTKQIAQYGLLTSIILVLGLVERQFVLVPGIPGIRLGLSNTVLLYALCLLSMPGAWLMMVLKAVLGGMLYAGPTGAAYSFAGGLLSMAVMTLFLQVRYFGLVGVSVAGAVAHMAGQILLSRVLLGSWAALAQAPLLLAAAVLTGVFTGVIATLVCGRWRAWTRRCGGGWTRWGLGKRRRPEAGRRRKCATGRLSG